MILNVLLMVALILAGVLCLIGSLTLLDDATEYGKRDVFKTGLGLFYLLLSLVVGIVLPVLILVNGHW